MSLIRSIEVLSKILYFNYKLVIVPPKLLNSCTHSLTNILLERNQYLLSPNPYLRKSTFLALLSVMGLAIRGSKVLSRQKFPNLF